MTQRVFNFSAGPSALPDAVRAAVLRDVEEAEGSGIGILEHSHRGRVYDQVLAETEGLWRSVVGIPEAYEILFIPGGATMQMGMIPLGFLRPGRTADYLDTGKWAHDAAREAARIGSVHIVASSRAAQYRRVPTEPERCYTQDAAYMHYCINNTVFGTRVGDVPRAPRGVPIVGDASSWILSEPVDVTRFGMLYGSTQKNVGPSAVAFVIIRRELLERARTDVPTMLRYDVYAEHESRYNTPNTFATAVIWRMLQWVERQGGLEVVRRMNRAKADQLYDFLDRSALFEATVPAPGDRSMMNVTFRTISETLDDTFCRAAEANGFSGLRGHAVAGGMRASIYNAMPAEGVDRLVRFMRAFEHRPRVVLGSRVSRSA